ncbi:hypothetical protein [Cognatilysobacter xinjiangensis]|uniref:hypothetical protein n=1 Tax=Cognatilysobacter xinjiangensis TaxID=546892 RepID=UPI00167441B8|nr:hypothetical protein [Lysobacter xinjiangensis]
MAPHTDHRSPATRARDRRAADEEKRALSHKHRDRRPADRHDPPAPPRDRS